METQWFKLITDNLVSCVIAYMLLKFFIEIMKKKLLENNETEKQNLQKNIEIFNSLSNLNGKFDNSKKTIIYIILAVIKFTVKIRKRIK